MTPSSQGIMGKTMTNTLTPEEKVLVVYRKTGKPGLWITIVLTKGDRLLNEKEIPLCGAKEIILTNKSKNMVQDFNELRFGAPFIAILPDKKVYIAFWYYEKMHSIIRWFKLEINCF